MRQPQPPSSPALAAELARVQTPWPCEVSQTYPDAQRSVDVQEFSHSPATQKYGVQSVGILSLSSTVKSLTQRPAVAGTHSPWVLH